MKKILHFQAAETAKQRGAAVIRYNRSHPVALGENCRYLSSWHGREINYSTEAGSSCMVYMAIGEVLYTRIVMADSDGSRKNMECMRYEIGKKRLT